ncbi:hypothetical protein D3C78_990120 [compost metagenome]
MHAGQLDGRALVARFDVLDQPQVFVVAAGFVAVVIQSGGIQRRPGNQLLEPVEQHRVVQAAGQFDVELAEQVNQPFVITALMRFIFEQQVIAQVLGHRRIATTAQFADDTDLDQATGFE